MEEATETRAGYVALIGLPNAGKSSLLNRLLGQKLSIVSRAPQTTRERVLGIDTRAEVQMVFLDTPGLLEPGHLLHRAMVHSVGEVLRDADVILLVIDGAAPPPEIPESVHAVLQTRSGALVVAINKRDIASPDQLGRAEQWATELFHAPCFRVSARTGRGVDGLRQALEDRLPHSPFFYPADDVSSQSLRFFTRELVRESTLELYAQEIPHSVAVQIDEFREERRPVYIRATVFVERESQKKILIGGRGSGIKRLGAHARRKIERLVDAPVYLDLWVKVLPKWRNDPDLLRRLGYTIPSSTG